MSDEQRTKTVEYYNHYAEEWVATHGGLREKTWWADEVAHFHDLLPSGRVLEIGPGSGSDAAALIELGYEYVGVDASQILLHIAQARNPGADLRLMDVLDLKSIDGRFDGFWAAAVLLHLPKTEIDRALRSLKRVMNPGAIGFISLKEGEGEQEDPGTGRWFTYYSRTEFSAVLESNGLEIVGKRTKLAQPNNWLAFYART
jgi:SAM-dependent methyltransferase